MQCSHRFAYPVHTRVYAHSHSVGKGRGGPPGLVLPPSPISVSFLPWQQVWKNLGSGDKVLGRGGVEWGGERSLGQGGRRSLMFKLLPRRLASSTEAKSSLFT